MKFTVRAGARAWEVDVAGEAPRYTLTIDGRTFQVDAANLGDASLMTLLLDQRSVLAHTRAADARRGLYDVSIAGKYLRLEVLDALASAARGADGGAERRGFELTAPMPGLVVAVRVAPGDAIEAGAPLVVMEAMKMQNELVAEMAGTVREVRVAPGNAVESGATLVIVDAG
jgi:3-methylcrotonyl-CoA carboxylase alpha subunit